MLFSIYQQIKHCAFWPVVARHTQIQDVLPVVLVLIEGGYEDLETARNMLKNEMPVIVIDGSGGAANFLAACYRGSLTK